MKRSGTGRFLREVPRGGLRFPRAGGPAGVLSVLVAILALPVPGASGRDGPPGSSRTEASGEAARPEAPAPDDALIERWLQELREGLHALLPRARWPSARWGLLAVSMDRGDTLVALEPDLLLAPASNVKLLSSAAAMDLLGPDFRYNTYLLADGEIRDGVLRGDLVLLGTGDPTLGQRVDQEGLHPFVAMARAVRQAGIRRVDGNVVGDATLFSGPERGPGWNPADFNDWFAAPVSALSYTENVVTVRIFPAPGAGARPRVEVEPAGSPLPVVNEARTVGSTPRSSLTLLRRTPADPLRVMGEVRAGAGDIRRVITVDDPPLHAAQGLRRALESEGVAVVGHPVALRDPSRSVVTGARTWAPRFGRPAPVVLAVHRSPPLHEILTVVNRRSHNLYADMVTKTLGRIVDGEGSFDGGARVVERFLVRRVGVPPGQVILADGSGLSRHNRATAGTFVHLLRVMAEDPLGPHYLETLPEAGSSTLRRMRRSPAEGNLRAKTGTIQAVSALSGIVRSADGETVLFSILANDVPNTWAAKDVEDRIGIRLAGVRRPPAGPVTPPAGADAPANGRSSGLPETAGHPPG